MSFQGAQLLTGLIDAALFLNDRFIQLGMALLRGGQLHVQLFKAGFTLGASLLQLFQLSVHLGQLVVQLGTTGLALFGLLRELKHLHLQLVGAGLGVGSLLAHAHHATRGFGVGRLGPHQTAAGFVGQQGLCSDLPLQVFNLLRPRQHARLFGIRCIKTHRELTHRVALTGHDDFAVGELGARSQCLVQIGGGVDALQPIVEQGFEATTRRCSIQTQQIGQAGKRVVAVGDAGFGQGIERQLGRWCIVGKRAHGVNTAYRQRIDAFAQRGLQRCFPAGFNVNLGPQTLQAIEPMFSQPGFEFALGLHLFLQCF